MDRLLDEVCLYYTTALAGVGGENFTGPHRNDIDRREKAAMKGDEPFKSGPCSAILAGPYFQSGLLPRGG
jgi:hypothetical protein